MASNPSSWNLLVFSDVHLGSDLVHAVQPDAPRRDGSPDDRDRAVVAFLNWYRERPQGGLPWKLVIAGDFVDFVGMNVLAPETGISTPLNQDDVALGLGGAEDHTIHKLRCVAQRHDLVFVALARFVAAGNTLVVVRGNHDVDFHWSAVQTEFVAQLAARASMDAACIQFAPWFYYEEGRVYVEHGHQYDRYCSYDTLLHPVSPTDPHRSQRSLSDVLLRNVVRPTRGMGQTGHESAGALDYFVFAVRLGVRGLVGLATRFAMAVATLFAIWRHHTTAGAVRVRERHDGLMGELATKLNLSLERLRELSSLQRKPVTHSFTELARTVMLDRILLGVASASAVLLGFLISSSLTPALFTVAGVLVVAVGVNFLLFRGRVDIEPSSELRDRAALVAGLFPAAFIVMGHTHLPEVHSPPGSPSVYVNLGAWAGHDDPGEGASVAPGASRTHLVLQTENDGRATAELRVWDAETGPRKFV